jgi:methionine-rich copper-binding protein CopC
MSRLLVPAISLSLMLASTASFAHAELENASPAADATLQSTLSEVALGFTEAVEPKFSTIKVQDSEGMRVDNADVSAAPGNAKRLSVSLRPLQPGTYEVLWRVTSTDTHKTNVSYTFKVAP